MFRRRRSELLWMVGGTLYLLIALPFLAWLLNSARLRDFHRLPSWGELLPAPLILAAHWIGEIAGERRGWIPWLSRTLKMTLLGLWILWGMVIYWPLLLPEGWGWLPAATYGLGLAAGVAFALRHGWDWVAERIERMGWMVAALTGRLGGGPAGGADGDAGRPFGRIWAGGCPADPGDDRGRILAGFRRHRPELASAPLARARGDASGGVPKGSPVAARRCPRPGSERRRG